MRGINSKKDSSAHTRELKGKYEKLLSEIHMHDRLYYKENNPQISDFEYDCLKSEAERLQEILSSHVENIDSPTIGDDRLPNFQSFEHLSPMLSLSNTYSKDEVFQFDIRMKTLLHGYKFSYIVEPKIDGVAINLIYHWGKFFKAITRGNGNIGDDVSQNISTINNFPLTINNSAEEIEIRGEIYIDKETFLKTNTYREENGLEIFANPRNLASGSLKTLDKNDVAERKLQLITYGIGYCSDPLVDEHTKIINLQSQALEYLQSLGFPSQEKFWVTESIDQAWHAIEQFNEVRHEFSYLTDGAVIKINNLDLHQIIGNTAKSPRWAIAYKFAPERAITKVKNIVMQTGRTGIVTPVAELDTVQLSGTTVSRATLHNADEVKRKDIRIGDYVVVEKAGEIIPAIIAVQKERRNSDIKIFEFPKNCPSCASKLVKLDEEVAWRCQNLACPAQIKRRLNHFVSKSAIDIDGFGPYVINKLVSENKLRDPSDIYRLTFVDLNNLEKFGTKSALKLLDNIDASKNAPFWRLIYALGISGIGEQTAKILTTHFPSIDKLRSARDDELQSIDGIGQKLASGITEFLNNPSNARIIENLQTFGLRFETQKLESLKNLHFSGKIFVITGTLKTMDRRKIIDEIELRGGHVNNSVSKKTNILVVGDNSGSKFLRAQNFGTEVWTEEIFLQKISEEEKSP